MSQKTQQQTMQLISIENTKLVSQINKKQMEGSDPQSTPFEYFTPKRNAESLEKQEFLKTRKSTAEKYYDLEGSFKNYEALLEQNLYLKNLMIKENMVQMTNPVNDTFSYIPVDQPSRNTLVNNRMSRNFSSKCLSTNMQNTQSTQMASSHKESNYQSHIQGNDVQLWSLKHRNNFLEQKLNNLQHQYQRQNKMVKNVKNSQKWKNRFDCKQTTCYQDKYIKLLRIRSPVLLD